MFVWTATHVDGMQLPNTGGQDAMEGQACAGPRSLEAAREVAERKCKYHRVAECAVPDGLTLCGDGEVEGVPGAPAKQVQSGWQLLEGPGLSSS